MLNLRYLSRIATRNTPDGTSALPNESDLARVNPAPQTNLAQPATGKTIGLSLRIGSPITLFPRRLIPRTSLESHCNRPGTGVLATTLSSLAIGQPCQQLDSVARLSLDLLAAQASRTRPREDRRSSSNDAAKDLRTSTPNQPLSILPEIELQTAFDLESFLGEYGWPLLGAGEQLARRPFSIQSLPHTTLDDSLLLDPARPEDDSKWRLSSNETRSDALEVRKAVIISKDFALQPIPIKQSSRPTNDIRRPSTGSSPPALVRIPPEHPPMTRALSFRQSMLALHRCESPSSISPSFLRLRPQSIYSFRSVALVATDTPCHDRTCVHDHGCLLKSDPVIIVPPTRPDPTADVKHGPSRRILIVGSSYTRGARRTATMFSVITLEGTMADKESLKHEFKNRGYSVESMVNNDFTGQMVLTQVAKFFEGARSGDVRAVVFTGHAWRQDNGPVMLIPPNSPTVADAISEAEWQDNIQRHAEPGVIVFSILAHCFSGDFMQQRFDLRNPDPVSAAAPVSDPGPIFITFSSTSGTLQAYESSVERGTPYRVADHFLHALVSTMRSPDVQDWNQFFDTFEENFEQVREVAAEIAEDGRGYLRAMLRSILGSALRFTINVAHNWPEPAPEAMSPTSGARRWQANHPQTPVFTVSEAVPCSTIF